MREKLKSLIEKDIGCINVQWDYSDLHECLMKAPYCYRPLVDACIVRDIPSNIKGDQLVKIWQDWFNDVYASPKAYTTENPVLDFVSKNITYYPAYKIFQHEIRAHRLPIVYSSLGILLASLQYRANSLFLYFLKTRDNKGKVSSKDLQKLLITETYIADLISSTRYVVESLATFRDMLILSSLSNALGKNSSIEKKAIYVLSILERKLKRDRGVLPYLIGYKMALTIFNKLDFWGIEAGVTYALNPTLTKKDFYEPHTSPFLRYNEIAKLSEQDISSKLKTEDPFAVDSFIREKCNWGGWGNARDSALEAAKSSFPEFVNSKFPSSDIFLPSHEAEMGSVIPEFIFVQSGEQKNVAIKYRASGSDAVIVNFFISLFRTNWRKILSTGKITPSNCPFRTFYGSSMLCDFYSDGAACRILKKFCDEYKLHLVQCF